MAFYPDVETAARSGLWEYRDPQDRCFVCNGHLGGPMVVWDGYRNGDTKNHALWMHRDCAMELTMGLVCDVWPNRRVAPHMRLEA